MNLSIIIPNYNGKKLLEKNLPKVLEAGKDCEIIVVDDASTDETVLFLKEKFPEVKVIEKKRNEGFASAVNLGVNHAANDFIFLLNSDCYPEKGSIEKVMKLFDDKNLFAVGFAQKSLEDGKIIIRGRGLAKFKKGFFVHSYGKPDKKNTQWVSAGAGIFRKSIWDHLGGMDEIYNPFYWEDIDLSYRALKSGHSILFEPTAFVVHNQQEGSIRSHYSKSYVEAISYRNQFLFVWLNISDSSFLFKYLIYAKLELVKAFLTFNWIFIKGHLMAMAKIFSVLQKRGERKKLWKKKDGECFVKV